MTEDKTKRALEEFLRPEFINRVDEIITFNPLTTENFKSIADIMLSDLAGMLEKKGIRVEYSESLRDLVAEKSYSAKFGARNMRRYIEREIEDRIAEEIIRSRGNLTVISLGADGDTITIN